MTKPKTAGEPKDPNAPKKDRKPRATSVAVGFAKKIEAKAAEKVTAEAADLANKIHDAALNSATALVGPDTTADQATAILTIAVGERVGVSKNAIAAARNLIQPGIAEAMLAGVL